MVDMDVGIWVLIIMLAAKPYQDHISLVVYHLVPLCELPQAQ